MKSRPDRFFAAAALVGIFTAVLGIVFGTELGHRTGPTLRGLDEGPIIWLQVFFTTIAAIIAFFNQWLLKRKQPESKETLEAKITRLTEALSNSTHVISEIEAEINERKQIAEQLQHDADIAKELKELSQAQVDAVAQTLNSVIDKQGKRSFWQGFFTNFLFYLLGSLTPILLSYISKFFHH